LREAAIGGPDRMTLKGVVEATTEGGWWLFLGFVVGGGCFGV